LEQSNKRLNDENGNFKLRIDEALHKINETERVSRQKDDALYSISKELEQFKNSLSKHDHVENSLKHEIINLNIAKSQAEKMIKEMKIENSELQMINKEMLQTLDSFKREINSLNNTLTIAQKHEEKYIVRSE
jgi:iron-sulfur cluster repair protein YtfE (RIC family)